MAPYSAQKLWKSNPPIAIPQSAATIGSILGVTLVSGGNAEVTLPQGATFSLRNQSASANIYFGDASTLTASGTASTGGRLLAANETIFVTCGPETLAGKFVIADAANAFLSIDGYQ
jgi:hypothetical protein